MELQGKLQMANLEHPTPPQPCLPDHLCRDHACAAASQLCARSQPKATSCPSPLPPGHLYHLSGAHPRWVALLVPLLNFLCFELQCFSILLMEGEVQITKTQQMVFINSYFLCYSTAFN